MAGNDPPTASFVIPAKDEEAYLPATLESLRALDTGHEYETIVVDGGSDDATPEIAREFGVEPVEQEEGGIGRGRDLGARRARGEWLAFVDADTTVRPDYLDRILAFANGGEYDAVSSRCRVVGARRGLAKQAVVNHVFPHLRRPVLPGFNLAIDRDVYGASGGFPDVPNEDTAFSRRLGASYRTGYCPDVLVETSARRFRSAGLTGTLAHYVRLDWHRIRTDH
ncbi:glycosyltransferase [Natronorarus salvus]|uniref:glycosyltransferase n=1 Tax=Natronorarus salvus TaxID=3117733 RepID=UPI002F265BA3